MAHAGHPSDLSDDCGSDGEYQPGWDAESDTDLDDPSTENLDSEELQPKGSQAQAQVVENQIHQFEEEGSYVLALGDDEPLFDGNRKPVEHYKRRLQDLDEEAYDHKEYAPGTEVTLRKTQERWADFCAKVLEKDWKKALQRIEFTEVYNFLDWTLNQRAGADGRMNKGIQSKSSLVTFWCVFRLMFERCTKYKIDKVLDRRRTSNALVELGNTYNLASDKRVNRAMTLADLKLQLATTVRTTEKSFRLGEVRMLAVLYLLLLAPAGSRPQSILSLRFGDIGILLSRDPHGGPHRLLIKFSLNFTKRYLGKKATKTFFLPEIIYDPSLLLSPHVFLLGILFKNRAFKPDALNDNPHDLAGLNIVEGENELLLPIRKELDDVPVFRRAVETPFGFKMSDTQPISQGMMTEWVKRIGELLGFEHSTISYSLRYMAGNSLDRSINVSESLRNLVMDHAPNSDTFQKHYLNRNVCMDIWAIQRGEALQQALLEQATSHGHSRSSRRPVDLSPEQSAALNKHPAIIRMSKEMQGLPVQSEEHRQLRLKIKAKKSKLFKNAKKDLRTQWTEEQAVDDIDRQLLGKGLPVSKTQETRPLHPAQQRVVDALTAPLLGTDLEAQYARRTAAINAIVAYCGIDEPLRTKVLDARIPQPPPELQQEAHAIPPSTQLRRSVFVRQRGERLKRCFICVGKALRLAPDDPGVRLLCRTYYDAAGVTRHFRSVHLKTLGEDEKVVCPVCPRAKLNGKMQLRHHAESVHGIKTNFAPV